VSIDEFISNNKNARKIYRCFFFLLEELHEALRSLDGQINTIDALPNEFNLQEFLHLFSSNMKFESRA